MSGSWTTLSLYMVPTRFVQKYTLRVAHLELGGVDFASVGLEKTGIANQTGRETSGSETGAVLSGTNGRSNRTVQSHGT